MKCIKWVLSGVAAVLLFVGSYAGVVVYQVHQPGAAVDTLTSVGASSPTITQLHASVVALVVRRIEEGAWSFPTAVAAGYSPELFERVAVVQSPRTVRMTSVTCAEPGVPPLLGENIVKGHLPTLTYNGSSALGPAAEDEDLSRFGAATNYAAGYLSTDGGQDKGITVAFSSSVFDFVQALPALMRKREAGSAHPRAVSLHCGPLKPGQLSPWMHQVDAAAADSSRLAQQLTLAGRSWAVVSKTDSEGRRSYVIEGDASELDAVVSALNEEVHSAGARARVDMKKTLLRTDRGPEAAVGRLVMYEISDGRSFFLRLEGMDSHARLWLITGRKPAPSRM